MLFFVLFILVVFFVIILLRLLAFCLGFLVVVPFLLGTGTGDLTLSVQDNFGRDGDFVADRSVLTLGDLFRLGNSRLGVLGRQRFPHGLGQVIDVDLLLNLQDGAVSLHRHVD